MRLSPRPPVSSVCIILSCWKSPCLSLSLPPSYRVSAMGGWFSNITAQRDKNILSKWMNISLISGHRGYIYGWRSTCSPSPHDACRDSGRGDRFFLPATFAIHPCSRPRPPSRRRKLHSIQSRSPLSFASSRSLDRAASLSVAVRFFCTHEFARWSRRRFSRLSKRYQHRWRHRSLHSGNRWLRALSDHRQAPTAALVLSRERHCRQHLHSEPNYSAALDRYIRSGPVRRIPIQAVSFSVQIGIVFEVIGPDNPLAATTFSFLTAATNIPVTYMMVADGHGYSARGIAGSFGLDASISIGACFLAGLLLSKFICIPFAQALSFRKSQTHCSKRTKKEHIDE